MKNKVKILVLTLFVGRPFLSSYTNKKVVLEWHAFRHAIKTSDGEDAGGIGHSFLKINNGSSHSVTLGHFNLKSGDNRTIGLWSGSALGSSSSGSSSSGFKKGILYNYERWYYCTKEKMQDDIFASYEMNDADINKLSDLVIKKNSTYSVITYNCATFTTDAWNTITGSDYWTGWNQTPSSVMDNIREYSYYNGNYSLSFTNTYYYYDESKGAMRAI